MREKRESVRQGFRGINQMRALVKRLMGKCCWLLAVPRNSCSRTVIGNAPSALEGSVFCPFWGAQAFPGDGFLGPGLRQARRELESEYPSGCGAEMMPGEDIWVALGFPWEGSCLGGWVTPWDSAFIAQAHPQSHGHFHAPVTAENA